MEKMCVLGCQDGAIKDQGLLSLSSWSWSSLAPWLSQKMQPSCLWPHIPQRMPSHKPCLVRITRLKKDKRVKRVSKEVFKTIIRAGGPSWLSVISLVSGCAEELFRAELKVFAFQVSLVGFHALQSQILLEDVLKWYSCCGQKKSVDYFSKGGSSCVEKMHQTM